MKVFIRNSCLRHLRNRVLVGSRKLVQGGREQVVQRHVLTELLIAHGRIELRLVATDCDDMVNAYPTGSITKSLHVGWDVFRKEEHDRAVVDYRVFICDKRGFARRAELAREVFIEPSSGLLQRRGPYG